MLVSILTPSFNQAKYLPDLITSLKSQTYRPIEHIICDGGSQDGTTELLAAYNHDSEGIRVVWKSEADRGQAHAINKAFNLSSGEIIGWINSDDVYFHKAVVQRVVETFETHPEVDVIHGDVAKITADNLVSLIWSIPKFNFERMFVDGKVSQPTVFLRRKVMEKHKLLENTLALDYEYWLRIGKEYRFLHLNDILAGDRNQPERISQLKSVELQESHLAAQKAHMPPIPTRRLAWYRATGWMQRAYHRLLGLFKYASVCRNWQNIAFPAHRDGGWTFIKRQLFTRIGDLPFDETKSSAK